jgi:hypothetical protein
MKITLFLDMTPCSPLPSAFKLITCLAYSSTLKMEAICPAKRRLTFNELHCPISQKRVLFRFKNI